MAAEIKVLDKGYVRLVDKMGNDLSIVRAARNSFDAAWRAGEDEKSDEKLMHYLWRNRHSTPFEAVTATFDVKAPIFVFRQWHRHRTQSYNEISARYVELPDEWYTPDPALIGVQSPNNKQARDIHVADEALLAIRSSECLANDNLARTQYAQYEALIRYAWPRELARTVLPLAMYSRMFATANLLNWFRFIELRNDPHAQYEIRVYAQALLELLSTIVPTAVEAFNHYKFVAVDTITMEATLAGKKYRLVEQV